VPAALRKKVILWGLIAAVGLLVVLAIIAVLFMAAYISDETESERTRNEMEVRRAERKLHQIARERFQAMLDEARAHGR